MKIFKCKDCGDDSIFIVKKEKTSTEVTPLHQYKHFDFIGKKEVIDCQYESICCGKGHTLVDEDGNNVTDYKGFIEWVEKHGKEEESEDNNPFALYWYDDYDADEEKIEKSKEVTAFLIQILDKMMQDISDMGITCEYTDIMFPVAQQIKALRFAGVGVGDTATDECIAGYIEEELKLNFKSNTVEEMGQDFYNLIHSE